MFSPRLRGFPPRSQSCACEFTGVSALSWCDWVCECSLQCWHPVQGCFLPPTLSCPGHAPAILDPELQWLAKESSYLFLPIFLKCIHNSHLFWCLILEVFGVSISKFGDVFVTRNTACVLNSCLYQLACTSWFSYTLLRLKSQFPRTYCRYVRIYYVWKIYFIIISNYIG